MATLSTAENVTRQALLAKNASRVLATLASEGKKRLLESMAAALEAAESDILFHNEIDVQAAKEADLAGPLVERLELTSKSIRSMAQGVREIAAQPDPVGEVLESWKRPNGI